MDFQAFEKWIKNLSDADQVFLQRHKEWKREYKKIQKRGFFPRASLKRRWKFWKMVLKAKFRLFEKRDKLPKRSRLFS